MSDKMARDGECRLCSTGKSVMVIDDTIRNKIVECYKIKVHKDDGMPQKICLRCKVSLCTFYSSMKACLERQSELLKRQAFETQHPHLTVDGVTIKIELHAENEPPAKKICKSIEKSNVQSYRNLSNVQPQERQLISVMNPAGKLTSPSSFVNHHREDKTGKTIPSFLIRYNCTFCLRSYPNIVSLVKHRETSHNQLTKYCDSLITPCTVRLERLDPPSDLLEPSTPGWVQINENSVRSINLKINHCFLTKTSYVRRYPQTFGGIDNQSSEDDLPLSSTSFTNDNTNVANDAGSYIKNLNSKELYEDDFNENVISEILRPEGLEKIVKASYKEYKEYSDHFKRKFVSKLRNGTLKVMWINNNKSVHDPYFLKSTALQKHLIKKSGLCSNMLGLKPYNLQDSSPTPQSEVNDIYFLTKLQVPSSASSTSVASTNTVVNQTYQGLPKIICAFSIPQDGNTQNDNTNSNNSSSIPRVNQIAAAQTPPAAPTPPAAQTPPAAPTPPAAEVVEHRPIIKCKPTSSLLAHSVSPQIAVLPLRPPTNGAFNVSNSNDSGGVVTYMQPINPPPIEQFNTDFESSMESSRIFNPDASGNFAMTEEQNTLGDRSEQRNLPILLNTLGDNSNSSYVHPSPPTSMPLILNDFFPQNNPSDPLQLSQTDVSAPLGNYISADSRNHNNLFVDSPSPKRLPLKDLQCKLKESSVDLKCGFCYKYLQVNRCLVKFKIVISEMCKKSVLNQTFHVKFNILPCNGFSIAVTDSLENSQDICRWLSKYQSQLIRAFKKDEILKTIQETVVGSSEHVRINVKVFLKIISEFKIDC